MCEPISASTAFAISAAMSVAGAAASFVGQQNAAKAQAEYAESQADATRQATINSYDQLQLQRQQDYENAQQKIAETSLDGAKARATAQVAAGEAGVAGMSVDQLLGDFWRQQDTYIGTVQKNTSRRASQIETEMEGVRTQSQSAMNEIRDPVKPDFMSPSLRAAGETLQAFAVFSRRDPETGKLTIPT